MERAAWHRGLGQAPSRAAACCDMPTLQYRQNFANVAHGQSLCGHLDPLRLGKSLSGHFLLRMYGVQPERSSSRPFCLGMRNSLRINIGVVAALVGYVATLMLLGLIGFGSLTDPIMSGLLAMLVFAPAGAIASLVWPSSSRHVLALTATVPASLAIV